MYITTTAIIILFKITSTNSFTSLPVLWSESELSSFRDNSKYNAQEVIRRQEEQHKKIMSSTQISHHPTPNTASVSSSTDAKPANASPRKKEHSSCQYVVSRNGIVLPWQQIHQQYRRVDGGDTCDKSSTQLVNNNKYNDNNSNEDNNKDNNTPLDSNKFLQLLPRGAYTTCRTVKSGSHIYQFDYHVRRLTNSAKSILINVLQGVSSSLIGGGGSDGIDGSSDSDGGEVEELSNDDTNKDSNAASQPTSSSTQPIQHEQQQLDSVKVNQLLHNNSTNVAWEHDMALKCIRTTLREFCTCYGIGLRRDGLRIDNGDNCEEGEGLDDEKVEFKITLLATWEKKNGPSNDIKSHTTSYESVLYCHVGLLQPTNVSAATTTTTSSTSSSKPLLTRVLIHGHGRENALAKDSKWVLDREKLTHLSTLDDNKKEEDNDEGNTNEKDWHQPFEEIILINNNGELLEGTQTNFYVVVSSDSHHHPQPNSIITANEGILYGSVRDSVLRACRYHDIHVELRPPTLNDLKRASGVFISSTSRWVMPVQEVCLGDLLSFQNDDDSEDEEEDGSGSVDEKRRNGKSYFYGYCKTTDDIRRWVLEDVESRSTPLY